MSAIDKLNKVLDDNMNVHDGPEARDKFLGDLEREFHIDQSKPAAIGIHKILSELKRDIDSLITGR